jgi:hypothetical protein
MEIAERRMKAIGSFRSGYRNALSSSVISATELRVSVVAFNCLFNLLPGA